MRSALEFIDSTMPRSLIVMMPSTAVSNAERVLEAIEALQANQRPQLALAALFVDLGIDA